MRNKLYLLNRFILSFNL